MYCSPDRSAGCGASMHAEYTVTAGRRARKSQRGTLEHARIRGLVKRDSTKRACLSRGYFGVFCGGHFGSILGFFQEIVENRRSCRLQGVPDVVIISWGSSSFRSIYRTFPYMRRAGPEGALGRARVVGPGERSLGGWAPGEKPRVRSSSPGARREGRGASGAGRGARGDGPGARGEGRDALAPARGAWSLRRRATTPARGARGWRPT
jgi:hypothetical protein